MHAVSLGPSDSRIHSLDGLRAVAILLVVVGHFLHLSFIPSGFGVTIFFVISGFLITRLLLAEFDQTDGIDLLAFYKRRLFRLMPAILVAIVTAAAVQSLTGQDWVTWDRIVASLLFFQNYWVTYNPFLGPLGIHWSLAVEEQFYLLFPIVLLFYHKRLGVGFIPLLLWVCLVVLLLRAIAAPAYPDIEAAMNVIYKATHFRIDTILTGCVLALMAHHKDSRSLIKAVAGGYPIMMGLTVIVAGNLLDGYIEVAVKYSTQQIGIALVMTGVLFSERCAFPRWLLNLPVMIWIGRISFGLYLLHFQANFLVAHYLPWPPHDGRTFPFALALAVLASWASYRWVEQPMIRLGKRVSIRQLSIVQGT